MDFISDVCHTEYDEVIEERCITAFDRDCEIITVPSCVTHSVKECTPSTVSFNLHRFLYHFISQLFILFGLDSDSEMYHRHGG